MARPSAAFSSVEASQYPYFAEIAKSDIGILELRRLCRPLTLRLS